MSLNFELITFFTAMLPFLELKLAIPLGIKMGLGPISTLLFAVAGAIIPAVITLTAIGPASIYMRKKFKFIDKFCKKLFHKTRKTHNKNFKRYGAILLIMLVAIPIPGSGTVTGSLVAFLFGVDYWKALSLISIGAMAAGILILAGSESIFAMASLFN